MVGQIFLPNNNSQLTLLAKSKHQMFQYFQCLYNIICSIWNTWNKIVSINYNIAVMQFHQSTSIAETKLLVIVIINFIDFIIN